MSSYQNLNRFGINIILLKVFTLVLFGVVVGHFWLSFLRICEPVLDLDTIQYHWLR